MTIDHLAGRVWSRIGPRRRAAFFGCLLAGFPIHLYAFTNLIPNSDGLSRVFDLQQMTVSGRWFLHYASALNAFTQMPAVIGLLSLVFLGAAAALTVDVLHLKSRVLAALTGVTMAAFPCLGYTFLYMFTASAYCLAIFLAVLSVWLVNRSKWSWLAGVCALAFSMGTYQAYASLAVSLALLSVLRQTMEDSNSFKYVIRAGLRQVASLALGAALYYIILQIFLKVKGLELLPYAGMDRVAGGYPLGRLPRTVLQVYSQAVCFFFKPGSSGAFANTWTVLLNSLLLLWGLVTLYCIFREKETKELRWRLPSALVLLALLPLGIGFAQVISPYSEATPIMKYAYVCVYLLAILFADQKKSGLVPEKYRGATAGAVAVLTAGLLLSFLHTDNLLYTASAQAHRATESYVTRLMARVEDCPGYEPGMEVALIGAIPNDQLQADVESYARVEHYSVPTDTVATLNKHLYYYLNDWLNIPIKEPDEATLQAISDSSEFKAMPLYPAQGSVQVLDGRVVVRLRETYTPKSDYERAYEQRR